MEEDYIDVKLDKDFIFCPITKEIIRHPVFASDGYNYELKALHHFICNQENRSPLTNKPLTFVIYDRKLKNTLDFNYPDNPDRYEDYQNVNELLVEIDQHLLISKNEPTNNTLLKVSIFKSMIMAAGMGVLAMQAYSLKEGEKNKHNLFEIEHLQQDLKYSFTLQISLLSGILDLAFRLVSKDRFGFFGAICKVPQLVCDVINHSSAPDPRSLV